MVSLKELRKSAAMRLASAQNDSPLADIDCVLMHLGFTKTDLILGDKTIDANQENAFWKAVKRLESGKPIQHITGSCEFMSLEFEVNSSTLIPRSDTEVLVEAVLDICKSKQNPKIFEVGSGSGCIAVSLAYYNTSATVVSADISAKALAVAGRNAKAHKVSDRVIFIRHNIFDGFPKLEEQPDIIVSNPPYIPKDDINRLDKKVREFEPLSALDGGEDGLDFYRFITENVCLKPNGYLAFEVGINQANDVKELMSRRFTDIKIIPDLAGIDRVVIGTFSDIK